MKTYKIAFAGNPNSGKTTLFNAYTGANLKVANWPGVTVEKIEGVCRTGDKKYILTDLPGTYSLDKPDAEEQVAAEYISSGEADCVIIVADSLHLKRCLYLTMQIISMNVPAVLALNMSDIAKKRGIMIDVKTLEKLLGIPIVQVSAKKKTGLYDLLETATRVKSPKIKKIPETIDERYAFIEYIADETVKEINAEKNITDTLDNIIIHPIFGVPVFLLIMAAVFVLTFSVGNEIKGIFENWLESFMAGTEMLLTSLGSGVLVKSLIVDGVISGVGGVLTFLPNIFILFILLAVLEDSGYMSRAAYVQDAVMSHLGLSGKAFIPLILGFGCTVPALLATRTLEKRKDRIKTILITPFISCSARLPVYVMLSGMFFERYAAIAAYSMYAISLITALVLGYIINRFDHRKEETGLLIELPEYRMPSFRTVRVYVTEKLKDYLLKAGTTIFISSVVLWVIMNFNPGGMTNDISDSFAAEIGRKLVPVMKPAGLGYWQIIVALISGIAAKEAVLSSVSVLFRVSNISSESGMMTVFESLSNEGFGPLNAYSMMLFCLLYIPCIASIVTIKRETNSYKFTIMQILFQLFTAYTVSMIFYRTGRMIF